MMDRGIAASSRAGKDRKLRAHMCNHKYTTEKTETGVKTLETLQADPSDALLLTRSHPPRTTPNRATN